jgi:hypothetical protein
LGVHALSNCQDGGDSFYTFKKCPSNYQESQLHLFDGDNNPNPWSMPFVVKRSDGALSHPMSQWSRFMGLNGSRSGGNKVALANTMSLSYELMVYNLKKFKVWVTSEVQNPVIPITKVVGQGHSCYLTNTPPVSSLAALQASTTSAYFSDGNDLYFRLIPKNIYEFITPYNGQGSALRYKSESSNVVCNNEPTPMIKGYVDSVTRENENAPVKIKGWACNFSKNTQIDVKLLVKSPRGTNLPVMIKSIKANLTSEGAVAFGCGVPNLTGFRFEFSLPRSEAEMHQGKLVYVEGVSTTGGANLKLTQSGPFSIPRYPIINNNQPLRY